MVNQQTPLDTLICFLAERQIRTVTLISPVHKPGNIYCLAAGNFTIIVIAPK